MEKRNNASGEKAQCTVEKTQCGQCGRQDSGLGGNQLTTPIVPNLPSLDNAGAVSGRLRGPRVRNLSLDLRVPQYTVGLPFYISYTMIMIAKEL